MIVPDSHALFDIRGRNLLSKADDELRDLLDIDDVFRVLSSGVDNLCAAGNLETSVSVDIQVE